MGQKTTLFTITGLKARVLRIVVGIPLLIIGSVMVIAGLRTPLDLVTVLLLVFGAALVLTGGYNCLGAIRGKDIPIKYGRADRSID